MSSRTFLWIEDRKGKASYLFWNSLLKQICPDVEVESKKNSSELVKAVKNLENTDNRYVILLDNSFDNLHVIMEQKLLKQYEWDNRKKDDICGLDDRRMTIYDKMKSIYMNTCLEKQFQAVGLEVVV